MEDQRKEYVCTNVENLNQNEKLKLLCLICDVEPAIKKHIVDGDGVGCYLDLDEIQREYPESFESILQTTYNYISNVMNNMATYIR